MTIDTLLRRAADDLEVEVRATIDAPAALARVEATGRPRRRVPWVAAAAAALLLVLAVAAGVMAATDDEGEPVATGGATSAPAAPPVSSTPPTTSGTAPGVSERLPVTAAPSDGLAEGATVEVAAEGVTAETPIVLVMCAADALSSQAGADGCDIDAADIDLATVPVPDASGRLRGSIVVERVLDTADADARDCATAEVRCAIGVVAVDPDGEIDAAGNMRSPTFELLGIVTVGFTPQEPLAASTVAMSPSTGLRHGQMVTVTGQGFAGPVGPGELCGPDLGDGPDCITVILTPSRTTSFVATDAAGGFTVEIPVWRSFPVTAEDGTQRIVDCAEVACTLRITGDDGRAAAPLPLAFDTAPAAPAPPTLAVTPTTGLRPGDPVTVTVTGLAAGQEANLTVCGRECLARSTLEKVVAGPDGEVSVTLPAVEPGEYGADCTTAGACALTLAGTYGFSADPMLEATVPVPMQYAP